jgi:hypothetical protein
MLSDDNVMLIGDFDKRLKVYIYEPLIAVLLAIALVYDMICYDMICLFVRFWNIYNISNQIELYN